jgi:hypothetical protein
MNSLAKCPDAGHLDYAKKILLTLAAKFRSVVRDAAGIGNEISAIEMLAALKGLDESEWGRLITEFQGNRDNCTCTDNESRNILPS